LARSIIPSPNPNSKARFIVCLSHLGVTKMVIECSEMMQPLKRSIVQHHRSPILASVNSSKCSAQLGPPRPHVRPRPPPARWSGPVWVDRAGVLELRPQTLSLILGQNVVISLIPYALE
jgi:hypothetical protein